MTTTTKAGKIAILGGNRRVLKSGSIAVYNAKGECVECCETCHHFTVSPADALAQVGSATQNYRSDEEIMAALQENGRPVFKLSEGRYSVKYQSGYFVMGCGRINCAHYHGYFVTSFGKLPGIVGGWGNSCCTGPEGYGYDYDQAQTLQKLEELKKEDAVIHTVDEDGFIFKTGYYPWWYQSYVGGAMTFKLCVISGHVTKL
jgi:hypothetical protein